MFRWWEITWFRTFFSVEIYLKGGGVLKFPKGYFRKFNIKRNGEGRLSELSWETRGFGKVLNVNLDEVAAIITKE